MTDSDPWVDRVRRGYDVVSRAFRADLDSPDVYASWLSILTPCSRRRARSLISAVAVVFRSHDTWPRRVTTSLA